MIAGNKKHFLYLQFNCIWLVMNNLRILLYVVAFFLVSCHPEGANVKQGLDKAAQLSEHDPDTASIILENIPVHQMNEAQLAEYNLLRTQIDEDKNIPHTSDKQIRQAVAYFEMHGDEYQKSKSYYYLACVESDLDQKSEAEAHFKKAIKLASQAEKYEHLIEVCKRCSLYYQEYGDFDKALDMERKAFANQLILNDSKVHTTTLFSSALGVFGVMSLSFGLFWRKNKRVQVQLNDFRDEMQRKASESAKLMLQFKHAEEKYYLLQQSIYEASPVVLKVRQFKERTVATSKSILFSEKEWGELLQLQENVYGLVSKLKEMGPKLTEEDIKVCAFLREGVQPAYFADIMKLSVETLTRRISRIKTEKLMLGHSKESLEEIIKSL